MPIGNVRRLRMAVNDRAHTRDPLKRPQRLSVNPAKERSLERPVALRLRSRCRGKRYCLPTAGIDLVIFREKGAGSSSVATISRRSANWSVCRRQNAANTPLDERRMCVTCLAKSQVKARKPLEAFRHVMTGLAAVRQQVYTAQLRVEER